MRKGFLPFLSSTKPKAMRSSTLLVNPTLVTKISSLQSSNDTPIGCRRQCLVCFNGSEGAVLQSPLDCRQQWPVVSMAMKRLASLPKMDPDDRLSTGFDKFNIKE